MPPYDYDDYDTDHRYDDSDEGDLHRVEEEDAEYAVFDTCFQDTDVPILPHVWKRLRIENAVIEVSDQGFIKNYNSLFFATKGYAVPGTPYRMFPVEVERGHYKTYYVHELVWWAFRGRVASGWVVRHKPSCTQIIGRHGQYDNSLVNLAAVPDGITRI